MNGTHCRALLYSYNKYKYKHAYGIMYWRYLFLAVSLKVATYLKAVHNIHAKELIKDVYHMITLDRCYRYRFVELLIDEYRLTRPAYALQINHAFYPDNKGILLALDLNLRKIWNNSTTVIRHITTFSDNMQLLLSFIRTFHENNIEDIVDMSILNFVDGKFTSTFLSPKSRLTYLHYISVPKWW